MSAADFKAQLERELEQLDTRIPDKIRGIALTGVQGITVRMPVDTGEARGGTNVTIGATSDALTGRLDQGGQETIAAAQAVLAGYDKEGDSLPFIHLQNAVEHLRYLEEGSSSQAPNGVFEVTVNDLRVRFTDIEL